MKKLSIFLLVIFGCMGITSLQANTPHPPQCPSLDTGFFISKNFSNASYIKNSGSYWHGYIQTATDTAAEAKKVSENTINNSTARSHATKFPANPSDPSGPYYFVCTQENYSNLPTRVNKIQVISKLITPNSKP